MFISLIIRRRTTAGGRGLFEISDGHYPLVLQASEVPRLHHIVHYYFGLRGVWALKLLAFEARRRAELEVEGDPDAARNALVARLGQSQRPDWVRFVKAEKRSGRITPQVERYFSPEEVRASPFQGSYVISSCQNRGDQWTVTLLHDGAELRHFGPPTTEWITGTLTPTEVLALCVERES